MSSENSFDILFQILPPLKVPNWKTENYFDSGRGPSFVDCVEFSEKYPVKSILWVCQVRCGHNYKDDYICYINKDNFLVFSLVKDNFKLFSKEWKTIQIEYEVILLKTKTLNVNLKFNNKNYDYVYSFLIENLKKRVKLLESFKELSSEFYEMDQRHTYLCDNGYSSSVPITILCPFSGLN